MAERKYKDGTLVIDFVAPPGSVLLDDPDRLTITDRAHVFRPLPFEKPRDRGKSKWKRD